MGLPEPKLTETKSGRAPLLTDDALFEATGVRIAFTGRAGGVSEAPFAELNLSEYVGDSQISVEANRLSVMEGLGAAQCPLLVPKQVHGAYIETVLSNDESSIQKARTKITEGADGIIVATDNVAAMLGFADCVPVILVAPNGAFAVVHSGWRGVMQRIAPKALLELSNTILGDRATDTFKYSAPNSNPCEPSSSQTGISDINIYIGPHIHGECFETSVDVHAQFTESFGEDVAVDSIHIDLNRALRKSLLEVGANPKRIADADICTVCNSDTFFSYRASGGTCGRHGAIAFRKPVVAASMVATATDVITAATNMTPIVKGEGA